MGSAFGGFIEDVTGINLGGSSRTDAAVRAQQQAAANANQVQREMYYQTRQDFSPYRDAGAGALSRLQSGDFLKNLQMDPGYQFRMQEGMRALQNAAAAKGSLKSGATLKALTRYGQDFASNEYQNAYAREYNRLSQLAGLGQASAGQQAAAGQNYAAAYGQNVMGAANAQAAATMAQLNQTNQLINSGAGLGMAALIASDRRLKKNIKKLPVTFKGVPVYEFEYIDPDRFGRGRFIGVMAQDLLALNPKHPAVAETSHGLMVNYDLLREAT